MLIHRERDAFERKLAELRAENVELKGLLGTVVRRLDQQREAIANIEARAAAQSKRLTEVKAELRSENEILRHQQSEIEQRYVALAQHL